MGKDKQQRATQGKVNKIAKAIDRRAKAGPSGKAKKGDTGYLKKG